MNDSISFLVEHGLPLEDIQSLLADGHSLEEITDNANVIKLSDLRARYGVSGP